VAELLISVEFNAERLQRLGQQNQTRTAQELDSTRKKEYFLVAQFWDNERSRRDEGVQVLATSKFDHYLAQPRLRTNYNDNWSLDEEHVVRSSSRVHETPSRVSGTVRSYSVMRRCPSVSDTEDPPSEIPRWDHLVS
jgi:hypothetical protein